MNASRRSLVIVCSVVAISLSFLCRRDGHGLEIQRLEHELGELAELDVRRYGPTS